MGERLSALSCLEKAIESQNQIACIYRLISSSDWNSHIAFRNGIIDGFEPKFLSISKDCKRYFDSLCDLEEDGLIPTQDVIEFSGRGSLWISYQYIEKGLLDLVQADLEKDVASREFYGPLFENTELVLARLLELQEYQRAFSIYKLAITHRLKAIEEECAVVRKTQKGQNAHGASKKWIKHYAPSLKRLVNRYEALLEEYGMNDPDLSAIKQTLAMVKRAISAT